MKKEEQLLYLSQGDVEACLEVKDSINAVEEGIRALGHGKAVQPEKIYLTLEKYNGFVKPMIAHVEPINIIASKVFSFFPGNPRKYGLPTVQAAIILTDPETGTHLALMDGTWITALRTAATTAIAAKYLSRKDSEVVGIVGAGVQGKSHLMALKEVFKLKEARISDISKEARERYAEEIGKRLELSVIPVENPRQCMDDADIILTVTTANEPLIKKDWIEPGMFIAKIGSFQEIDPEIIIAADKVVVDWWEYVSKRVKELIKLLNAGLIRREDIYAELPEIVAAKKPGRQTDDEVILFISIGMGVEDAATALHAYKEAMKKGMGTRLER